MVWTVIEHQRGKRDWEFEHAHVVNLLSVTRHQSFFRQLLGPDAVVAVHCWFHVALSDRSKMKKMKRCREKFEHIEISNDD